MLRGTDTLPRMGLPPMNLLSGWLPVDGFAWPWLLPAALLPLLVRALPAAKPASGPALRVPWTQALQDIAAAGTGLALPRRFPWLLLCAWVLLSVAAARPPNFSAHAFDFAAVRL